MKTNWVPKFNSSPFAPPGLALVPGTPVFTKMRGPIVLQGTTYYILPDGTVATTPPLAIPVAPAPVPGVRTLIVPFWIPLGVIGFAVWRLRFSPANLRRRRMTLGLCLVCGYDLRASEERCPECGSKIQCATSDELAANAMIGETRIDA